MSDWSKATERMEEIECPYCGEVYNSNPRFLNIKEKEVALGHCSSCGKHFSYRWIYDERTYQTKKV